MKVGIVAVALLNAWRAGGLKEGEELEVRLAVEDDGSWQVWFGDVSYDTHHSPYCASGTLYTSDRDVRKVLARQLIEEIQGQRSEDGHE